MNLDSAEEMQLDALEEMSRQGSEQSVRDAEFAEESGEDDDASDEDFSPEDELRQKLASFKTAREFAGSVNASRNIVAEINTEYDTSLADHKQMLQGLNQTMEELEADGADISGEGTDEKSLQYNNLHDAKYCITTLVNLRKCTTPAFEGCSLKKWLVQMAEGATYRYHAVRHKRHEANMLEIKRTAKRQFDMQQLEAKRRLLEEKMEADMARLEKKHAADAEDAEEDILTKRAKPSSRSGRGRGRGRGRALYKPPGRR
jgi:hypothetical protein